MMQNPKYIKTFFSFFLFVIVLDLSLFVFDFYKILFY